MKNLLLFLLEFLCLAAYGAMDETSTLEITSENNFFNPSSTMSYLMDTENNVKISDILQPKYKQKFAPVEGEIASYGIATSSVWLRFSIQNALETSPYIEIMNPSLDTVAYYLFNNRGELVHQHITGNFERLDKSRIKRWPFIFDMQIDNHDVYTCYIQIINKSNSAVTPIRIAHLKQFYFSEKSDTLWQGLYFGLIATMLVYNIFLFFSLKESSYLYFAMFISCIGLAFGLLRGLDIHYIWNDFPVNNQFLPVISSLAGVFIILFTSSFLNARINAPRLYIWLMALIGLYILIMAINFIGFTSLSNRLFVYNSLFVMFFIFFMALQSWRDGFEPSKYFLLAWSVFVVGFVIFMLRDHNLIAVNNFNGNILQISTTLSILFLSFALSKRINIYIASKNEAQELALLTAIENEKLVTNQNQLLEAKVQQRTIDLEQSIKTLSRQSKELREANTFKDKVFSIISHDLNSPISTLAGMLKLMKIKSLDELERTKVVESLEITLKSTKILLDNILAWANKQDNKRETTEELELLGTVNEILDLFRYQATLKGIALNNMVEREFYVYANKNMLQLVLRNLISNAIKFTPKKGHVDVLMDQDNLDLLITVKDSGIGMSADALTGLFTANKHTSTRGTDNEKGTGLGLILCKEFVDKYDGKLSVQSEPGKGTAFTIRLKKAIPILETVMEE